MTFSVGSDSLYDNPSDLAVSVLDQRRLTVVVAEALDPKASSDSVACS